MPPSKKLDHTVILYDLNCENQEEIRKALFKISTYYYSESSKNLMSLILVNYKKASETNYIFKTSLDKVFYDPTLIQAEITDIKGGNVVTNWKKAVKTALEVLLQETGSNKNVRQILFLTDMSNCSTDDTNIDNLIIKMKENNIHLFIVGPEIKLNCVISSFSQIPEVMKNISFANETKPLLEVKKFVNQCSNAMIFDLRRGLQLFLSYKGYNSKKPWTVPLTIGTNIHLPVDTYKLTEKDASVDLDSESSKSELTIFASAEDTSKVYSLDNIQKGLLRHCKFIPLDDDSMFKPKTERSFSILFTTKMKNIPEYLMKGPLCYTVMSSGTSHDAFDCFISRLEAKQCCAIAKKVYASGFSPTFFVLIPVPSKGCFTAVELPSSSDIVFEWIEQEPVKDSSKVNEEVKNYLDALKTDYSNCQLDVPLKLNLVNNNANNKLINLTAEKIVGENLEKIDFDVFSPNVSSNAGESLRNIWPSTTNADLSEDEIKLDSCSDDDDDDNEYF